MILHANVYRRTTINTRGGEGRVLRRYGKKHTSPNQSTSDHSLLYCTSDIYRSMCLLSVVPFSRKITRLRAHPATFDIHKNNTEPCAYSGQRREGCPRSAAPLSLLLPLHPFSPWVRLLPLKRAASKGVRGRWSTHHGKHKTSTAVPPPQKCNKSMKK